MKANLKRTLCLLLATLLILSLTGCGKAQTNILPKDQAKHSYSMDLTLNEEEKTLTGQLVVAYENSTGKTLTQAPFFVYPNAFANENAVPFSQEYMGAAYPNGFSAGGLTLTHLSVDGVNTTYTIGNDDDTLLTVDLPIALAADESANITFAFTVTLPNSLGRFGYGDKTINLCNFYPIACAYDGTQFLTYPYYERGDPFVSDMADYGVTLRVPSGMVVAHTGTATMKTENGLDVYTIAATDVRDFAAVCSRYFTVKSERVAVGGTDTVVYAYTFEDAAYGEQESLDAAVKAVKAFSNLIGPYPYQSFNVVQTDFFIGGMEYPNIVLIDQSMYDESAADMLEYVIVHETGHQWFYGVVGNDQVAEPWLDEALTEYLTLCYYGYTYSEEAQNTQYEQNVEFVYMFCDLYDLIPEGADRVGMPVTSYDNDYVYSAVVYSRGTMMFNALADEVGQAKLLEALSVYYTDYAGKRATKEDLLRVLDEQTGFDCSSFLNGWL